MENMVVNRVAAGVLHQSRVKDFFPSHGKTNFMVKFGGLKNREVEKAKAQLSGVQTWTEPWNTHGGTNSALVRLLF